MKIMAFAALIGASSILLLPRLPPIGLLWTGLLVSLLLLFYVWRSHNKYLLFVAIALLFFCYHALIAQQRLQQQLPQPLQNKMLHVTGEIVSLPRKSTISQSFLLQTTTVENKPQKMLLRLSWYDKYQHLRLGQQWQLLAKLKRIHAYANPGSFDDEAYALEQNLAASGYVRRSDFNHKLSDSNWRQWLSHLRQVIAEHLQNSVKNKTFLPMIEALVIGDKSGLSATQWQVLQRTGTNHLMVIAGLHVGMLSGLVFLLVQLLWRTQRQLALRLAAKQAGAIAALSTAIVYSALAGFSIPTVRATVMLAVFMCALIFKRQLSLGLGLAYALFLVLLLFPLATMSVGFWLSFAAVSIIFYGMSARLAHQGWWWKWGRLQWVVSVGLIPFTLFWFQNASLISPLANTIVIPLVGFIVVPISLLGTLLSFCWPVVSLHLFALAVLVLKLVWAILNFFAHLPMAAWQHGVSSFWVLLLAVLATLLLLAPKAWPAKWLALFLLLPLFLTHSKAPSYGQVKFTLLDVGQGLASVVQTQHHVLVFDTGAKYSANFNLGAAVVVPFLHSQGIGNLSLLMISHGDNDHIGGAESVLQAYPGTPVLTSVPERFHTAAHYCLAGEHWHWDGVNFLVLSPSSSDLGQDNNSSCVLKVSADGKSVLLTGDIEKPAEHYLLQHQRQYLAATVIVAPHHGSKTSSSLAFVNATHPQWVLYPVGYLNKYHFPSSVVVVRYDKIGAQPLRTDNAGAITLWLRENKSIKPIAYRLSQPRFWRHV